MKSKFVLFSLLLVLGACAHSIKNNLAKIERGMTRADVVDLLGSPVYVDRNQVDRHVWDYRFYDEDQKAWSMKSVVFEKDVVVELTETKEREVVLKNKDYAPVYEEFVSQERAQKKKAVSNQDWLKELDEMQRANLQQEKEKVVPSFQSIK